MTRSVTRTVVLAALFVLAISAVALARPIAWGGSGSNDLGPGSLLLSVANARVKVTNVQVVMACTDTQDGTESDIAFDAKSPNRATLAHNRFSMHWAATSGGREGTLRLSGTLGSNGRGTATVHVTATGRDSDTNAVIERCSATVHFHLRRGN